jgi:hypothetical protein
MHARRAILGSWPVVAPFLPVPDSCSQAWLEYRQSSWAPLAGSSTVVYTIVVYRNGRDQELTVLACGAEMLAARAIDGWSRAHRGRRQRDRLHADGCGVRGYDRRLTGQGHRRREDSRGQEPFLLTIDEEGICTEAGYQLLQPLLLSSLWRTLSPRRPQGRQARGR